MVGDRPTAFFSDGTTADIQSGLQRFGERSVTVNGKTYVIARPKTVGSEAGNWSFSPDEKVMAMPDVPERPVNQIQVIPFGGRGVRQIAKGPSFGFPAVSS